MLRRAEINKMNSLKGGLPRRIEKRFEGKVTSVNSFERKVALKKKSFEGRVAFKTHNQL